MVGLAPKWVRLDPKVDKSNLTHYAAKPTIPDVISLTYHRQLVELLTPDPVQMHVKANPFG